MPQDFSGHNLRGRSFKGQNLEGANFSYADIRSADFTGANLRNANFSHAKAGLQRRWVIVLVLFSLLLSVVSGWTGAIGGVLIGNLLRNSNIASLFTCIISLIVLPVFFILTFYQDLVVALGILAVSAAIVAAMVGVVAIVIGVPLSEAVSLAGSAAGIIAGGGIVAGSAAIAVAVAGVAAGSLLQVAVGGVAISIATAGVAVGGKAVAGAMPIAALVSGIGTGIAVYVGWYALAGNNKQTFIRNIALTVAAWRGTSFYTANLSGVNFNKATLKKTNFVKANLTQTRFYHSQQLNLAIVGESYLSNAKVQQWVVTGAGQDKNFNRLNLRGVNFQGANLIDASFIGTDLSEANLQDADLSRAKLVQTQLDRTDLTGATLTGATIEDWGVTSHTNLHRVRCKYVFMRLVERGDPDQNPRRKPDNWDEDFSDGDFSDFIQPIFDTLDLYHNQDVDPRAIAISFKQLGENHPDADLRIVGMEVRGEDKFLLRAKTAIAADKSQLSAEYVATYNKIKGLPEREIKLLLEEKDSRIRSLEIFVNQALQRPSFYSSTQIQEVGSMASNPGGFSIDGSVGGNVNNVQGEGNQVVQGDTTMTDDRNINTGGGNYNERIERDYIQGNYYAAGQPQSLAQAAADIQLLLKQLEQTYPTTTTSQQMVVAAEAINRIETNPLLKKRVINAVKEGGLAAFEKAIDNPAGAFIVGAIKGWQEVEAED